MAKFIRMCDGYKLDHRRQYPAGTTRVYENFTARGTRIEGTKNVIFAGLQGFQQEILMDMANATFFNKDRKEVVDDYQKFLDQYAGPGNGIGTDHIAALHKLGYIPLEFHALEEGTHVPLRMPMFTYENTHDDFFWVPGFVEDMMSFSLWQMCTSATEAHAFRNIINKYGRASGVPEFLLPFLVHDFSLRGMTSVESAARSGFGHLLSFTGSDNLPAIDYAVDYYGADYSAGAGVPATEHSVMCAGGSIETEKETFLRLLDLYKTGIVSVVSDTTDFWNVVTNVLPSIKKEIMARDGKLVIRPDSGDPADIICGTDPVAGGRTPEARGLIECLWNTFSGTKNAAGYWDLDSHIGAIYGDSITRARAEDIAKRLMAKGFSTGVVLGVGSYTYQYTTRDTHGFAIKGTANVIKGIEHSMSKSPKGDSLKKSAKGRIVIVRENGALKMIDGLSLIEAENFEGNLLTLNWRNGQFYRRTTLEQIRAKVSAG